MRLRMLRLGAHAARFVRRHGSARVTAVFDRSLHLEADGDFLCLGSGNLGDGPLNAIVAAMAGTDWIACAGPAGGKAIITSSHIRIADLVLDTRTAAVWQPPTWPREIVRETLLSGVEVARDIARRAAPAEGLVRPALNLQASGHKSTPLERIATSHLASLRDWLDAGLAAPPGYAVAILPPIGLLGVGPGLTPSGDDVLCGTEIALHAVGRRDVALSLAAAIGIHARERTSPLSCAFLRAAADGQGGALLHEAIAAIAQGAAHELPLLLVQLGRVGHTSGWDALAGAVLALSAYAGAARATRSP